MPLQNRLTPSGDIIATAARGTMYGNRGGCFHNDDQTLKSRHWASKQWICCVLEFKGRRRRMMQPGLYTELFCLDEATALAAGHRPCFECRRDDANRFAKLWLEAHGGKAIAGRATAPAMDDILHAARINAADRMAATDTLPDGVFIQRDGDTEPHLIVSGKLRPWSPGGYGQPLPRLRGQLQSFARVLTPLPTIAVIARGYRPMIHLTAAA